MSVQPTSPVTPQAHTVQQKSPDFSVLGKLAQREITTAENNYKLYASGTLNLQARELARQYKDDPIQLANGLQKLPDMISGVPKEIADPILQDFYLSATSMVEKAEANRVAKVDRELKQNARQQALVYNEDMADDFFNLLVNMEKPKEERSQLPEMLYVKDRLSMRSLATLTDSKGDGVLTAEDTKNALMPKESILQGAKTFIDRFEVDELKQWDSKTFQDKKSFMKQTSIDADTYDSISQYIKTRIKALNDTKDREIHGQAYYDALNLITEPTQVTAQRIKDGGIISSSLVDKISRNSVKATESTYAYDPLRKTSPNAFYDALNMCQVVTSSNDWSFDGRKKVLESCGDAMAQLGVLAKETNMSPDTVESIKTAIQRAITNPDENEKFNNFKQRWVDTIGTGFSKTAFNRLQVDAKEVAAERARENYNNNMAIAMSYYATGNDEMAEQIVQKAGIQYAKDSVAYMGISSNLWEKLEKNLADGKPAKVTYMGQELEFLGFDDPKQIFKVKL